MKKFILAAAAATTFAVVPAAPALADHDHRASSQVWRGEDGRYYCRKSNGTVGLLVGGGAGALVGRAIDTRGSRATGTILGAVGGALIGREIQRNRSTRRCR